MLIGETVTGSDEKNLVEVSLAAEMLGVKMQNVVIHQKRESFDIGIAEKKKKNIVDIISENNDVQAADLMDIKKENMEEFIIEGNAEVDYPDGRSNILYVSLSGVNNSPIVKPMEVPCKVCGECFSTKKRLSKHMQHEHKEEKPRSF